MISPDQRHVDSLVGGRFPPQNHQPNTDLVTKQTKRRALRVRPFRLALHRYPRHRVDGPTWSHGRLGWLSAVSRDVRAFALKVEPVGEFNQ